MPCYDSRAQSYKNDKVRENYSKKKGKLFMATPDEIETGQRFLRVYNIKFGTNFELGKNQPLQDDIVDLLAQDSNSRKLLKMQIRVSDDEPWKDLKLNKMFERKGKGFAIHHNNIKNGILAKSQKYSSNEKNNLLLVLDGWQSVRQEDIEEFRRTEQQLLRQSGFREIWFVGNNVIKQIYP